MRKIKFRAWDRQQQKMFEVSDVQFSEAEIGVYVDAQTTEALPWDERLELMQFTGLKDKNGKEIYEGDVIHCTAGMRTPDKTFQTDETKAIAFEDGAFRYDGVTLGDMTNAHMSEYTFEVMGNVYENPELIA